MSQGKIFNWAAVDPWPSKHSWVAEKVVTGKNMQLIRAEFQPGATYRFHSHEREQFSFMLSGRMRLTVGDEISEIGPGDMWYAPGNVVHGGEILGDEPVVFVDVYSPPAEEFKKDGE